MVLNEQNKNITSNTSIVFDAVDYLGRDAYIIDSSDYSNNQAARTTKVKGYIFETEYFPADSFVGTHQFSVTYKSDSNNGDDNDLAFEVWRRLPGSTTEENTKNFGMGTTGGGTRITDWIGFFNAAYEYKFKIRTAKNFNGTYADVDMVQLLRISKNQFLTWMEGYAYNPLVGLQNYVQYGTLHVQNDGADSISSAQVTFPIPFTSTPQILISAYSDWSPLMVANMWGESATGVTIVVRTDDATAWSGGTSVNWMAFGTIRPEAL